jgi:class 3 adenylate cyclase/CHASE3 domain sensor protein
MTHGAGVAPRWRFVRDRPLLARLNRPVTNLVARLPLRLEWKLLAAFLGSVLLMVLLGAAGLAVLDEASRRTERVIRTQERVATFRQLGHDSRLLTATLSLALWMPTNMVEAAVQDSAHFRTGLAALKPLGPDEAGPIAELRRDGDRFLDLVDRELALLRSGNVDGAGALQMDQVRPAAERLDAAIERLDSQALADMVNEIAATRAAYRAARNRLIVSVAAAALVGIYLAHTIASFVVGPLGRIGVRLAEIAAGEFNRRVVVPNRDEIAALADSVNRTSQQLGGLYRALEAEKERSEELLYQILPRQIAERVRAGETLIADRVPMATILFSDLAGFTEISNHLAPEEVVDLLDILFSRFDALVQRMGLEKIKTIGDGYMVAGGVLEPRPDHAAAVAEMALAMRAATDIATRALGVIGRPLQVRIGLHSGPVVAGVVGTQKLVYDIWGDTVNTASRMEHYGEPGRICVSAATRALLGNQFRFEPREPIEVKGKGTMETFFLERHIGPPRRRNLARLAASHGAG